MKALPNILSAVRIVLATVFVVMYLQDELIWRSLSIAVFAVAAVTDFFDGYIARHYKVESASGAFLDPLADKILTFSGFACVALLDPVQFPWWGVILIVIRDVITTLLRIYADKKGLVLVTLTSAKVKTAIQMVFLYIALLNGVFLKATIPLTDLIRSINDAGYLGFAFRLVVFITVFTGFTYLWKNLSNLKGYEKR
jgi:CDP-diacylglycerol--glycerol-3-phosphate 3-phosphatidyltransferase